jgi:twitching motility protein PilT
VTLKQLLAEMLARRSSDLHLRVGVSPVLRIDGALKRLDVPSLSTDDINTYLGQMLTEDQRKVFARRHELDLALSVSRMGRFRINIYRQRGTTGIAIRAVRTTVPSFEELNLPEVVKKLANERRGIIVVTGTTGSGKSTTLAAMVEYINSNRAENILTIEDPIEYVFADKRSIIGQREIGADTESFAAALRQAMRQDPDVILIGEIRDLDTMQAALQAADTGHLVMTTLHTLNVIETVHRMISFFPPHQHEQVRLLLGGTLRSILCQRLMPRCDGPGRVPAVEAMVMTGAIRECMIDPVRTPEILDLVESGAIQYGMQTFDQSILSFYRKSVISYDEALNQASNPDDFELRVRGIVSASDRGFVEFTQGQGEG